MPTLKFATAIISVAAFLAYYGIYVPYFASSKGRKKKGGQGDSDDSEDSVAGAGSPGPEGEDPKDPKNNKPEREKPSQEGGLTKGGRQQIKNIEHLKDNTVSEAIRQRGGGAGQVNEVDTAYQKMKVSEVANRAAQGDRKADTALKMIKQAIAIPFEM